MRLIWFFSLKIKIIEKENLNFQWFGKKHHVKNNSKLGGLCLAS